MAELCGWHSKDIGSEHLNTLNFISVFFSYVQNLSFIYSFIYMYLLLCIYNHFNVKRLSFMHRLHTQQTVFNEPSLNQPGNFWLKIHKASVSKEDSGESAHSLLSNIPIPIKKLLSWYMYKVNANDLGIRSPSDSLISCSKDIKVKQKKMRSAAELRSRQNPGSNQGL